MRRSAFLLPMLLVVVIATCGGRQRDWPMTREQLKALKAMPRAERDRWFAGLRLPEYEAHRRVGVIRIDGVLNEPAWRKAERVTLQQGELGGPVHYATHVRMLWDDEAIYLAFECDDPDVHQPLTRHDDPLWQHDLVEVFIDPNGDGACYMELHVAPSGATADSIYADFSPDADWFAVPNWERFVDGTNNTAFDAPGVTAVVDVDGTLNQHNDTDQGYIVEWRIPYTDLTRFMPDPAKSLHKIDVSLFERRPVERPKVGTVWRMNFNRCDDSIKRTGKNAKGEVVSVPEYSAWAPTTGSFHMPFLFGRVTFVE